MRSPWRESTGVAVVDLPAASLQALPIRYTVLEPLAGSDTELPPVVLLHGLGDNADLWCCVADFWPAAAQWGRLIALDLPGHGRSGWLRLVSYRSDWLADLVAVALKAIGVHRAQLVGHSLGARVALQLAGRRRLRIDSIVLIDFNVDPNAAATEAIRSHVDALAHGWPTKPALYDYFGQQLPLANPATIHNWIDRCAIESENRWRMPVDPLVTRLLDDPSSRGLARRTLQAFAGPVAVIRGGFSSIMTDKDTLQIASMAVDFCGTEIVEQAGHAIPLEQPAALARALSRLLPRVSP